MPLHRRLPKRGFHNIFRKEYAIVNVKSLAVFEAGAKIDPEILQEKGIIKKLKDGIKILGSGELQHPIHVRDAQDHQERGREDTESWWHRRVDCQ